MLNCFMPFEFLICVYFAQQPKNTESRAKLVKKLIKKDRKTRNKLKSHGIDYKFPGYVS